jgi:oligopeptide/dipeptide ABC transporter ATP-binding protein
VSLSARVAGGRPDRDTAPLLACEQVVKHFPISRGGGAGWERRQGRIRLVRKVVHAVNGITLEIRPGETFALVGESGCGKSTLARLLVRSIQPTAGQVRFQGRDVWTLPRRDVLALRKSVQMVFQDPYGSLNPRMRIADIIAEPLRVHGIGPGAGSDVVDRSASAVRARVAEVMKECGLDVEYGSRYPHEFSGGQRQRVAIARALASQPACVVLDEPVSALDVSVQAQILNLLLDMQERRRLTYVLVSHDLAVVRQVATRVAVMYLGSLCEVGSADQILGSPRHHYTRALLRAVPDIAARCRRTAPVLGELPSATDPPAGCAFHPRCPAARERCSTERPRLEQVAPGHWCACHYPADA